MKKERCKETIWDNWTHRNCSRNAVKDGYCKQHHPDNVKERERQTDERWKAKQESSPWNQLTKAIQKIKKLEAEIEQLKTT